ncbi:alpha/beta fold hydrolase [Bradymonadaceae bacterium TMQ3]|uniref:Alpha/beta fold hydrolase n=1 Tax=Lujinxingia sediminis TaxID=2480984 RepID=A0ABY0CPD9_9DELT|nr:alpha/beta fold hydrolase [Lujinxingia sediminis]RDV36388.1 alpha/beta fold hydrolase [Bradymonadaceae bacterium TMQ3]RVU41487.1 alpha/beta fold hydrolase [Lujinxingia sediminis]TXC68477.1 alpha/beta hydrolase [Bradymonadales bacterium TMQ1]
MSTALTLSPSLHVVEELREGPLIIGLHGWGGSHHTFDPLREHLPPTRAFAACDWPGYGHSQAPADFTLDAIVEPVAGWLRDLRGRHPGPFIAVGSCSGALFGIELLRRHAGALDHLVMVEPFAFNPWYLKLFLIPGFGRLAYTSTFANPLGRWLTNRSLAAQSDEQPDMTTVAQTPTRTTLSYLRELDRMGNARRFTSVTTPLSLVHGERTFGALIRGIPIWQELFPCAQLDVVEGAGHLPLSEKPELLARLIEREATRTAAKVGRSAG